MINTSLIPTDARVLLYHDLIASLCASQQTSSCSSQLAQAPDYCCWTGQGALHIGVKEVPTLLGLQLSLRGDQTARQVNPYICFIPIDASSYGTQAT